MGFPFTSGPVSLFLALDHGTGFAAAAAVGSIASVVAQGVFALTYTRTAYRGWGIALLAATAAFGVSGAALSLIALTPTIALAFAWLMLVVAARLMPAPAPSRPAPTAPAWDLPARMVVGTVLVLALTSVAPILGPFASGVLSGFPLYATILGVFAQRVVGPAAAIEVMRGLATGLFAFAGFFFVISASIVTLGVFWAFVLAIAVVLAIQAVSFASLRRRIP